MTEDHKNFLCECPRSLFWEKLEAYGGVSVEDSQRAVETMRLAELKMIKEIGLKFYALILDHCS
ncbi:MAG: hypothetical protein A6F72_02585 [Cycloclasticus sp. symbiont of Poecilosclerida sp. N]|nr:MAG: hypothetical protein A6F72_02585 [Cycloclasticus sp. symbiont of Poecilosclerida sp. N]